MTAERKTQPAPEVPAAAPAPEAPRETRVLNARSGHPSVARERVLEFVRDASAADRGKLRCPYFALIHLGGEEREAVKTVDVPPRMTGAERDARVEKAADRIVEAAMAIVRQSDSGLAANFLVGCYQSVDPGSVPLDTLPFRIEPERRPGFDLRETEGPNGQGITSQQMRHTEQFARMCVGMIERTQERAESLVARMLDRTESLEDRNLKLATLVQDLLDRGAQRALDVYKGRLEIERTDRLYRAGELLLSRVAGRYLGVDELADHPIMSFLKGLSPQEAAAMIASLPEDKQQKVFELMQSLDAATGAAAMTAPKMGNGVPS